MQPDPSDNPAAHVIARARAADRRANLAAVFIGTGTLVLASVPYLAAWAAARGRPYMGLGYNLDDSCVYLAWMRQAAEGRLIAVNLFTTGAQHGMLMNPLFLVAGTVARAGLPLIIVYHLFRILFGGLLTWLVWRYVSAVVSTRSARVLALAAVCVGSGIGWLPFLWRMHPIQASVDTWQPEAVTFLSLYLSPLFCAALCLQLAILMLLRRAQTDGGYRYAVGAGVLGLVLALVHSYDVATVAFIWIVWLATCALSRRLTLTPTVICHAALAGLITLPGVAYMFMQYRADAVFRKRALVPTLAGSPLWIVTGYGLLILLAALWWVRRARNMTISGSQEARQAATETLRWGDGAFLTVWFVANVAASYAPHLAFQRKLLQGAHIPIAILAGVEMAELLRSARLPNIQRSRTSLAALAVLVLSLTNARFAARDLQNAAANSAQTKLQRPYLLRGELAALDWLRDHAARPSAIQPLPWIAVGQAADGHATIGFTDASLMCFAPEITGLPVYCGHWGETPDFGRKLGEIARFMADSTPESDRLSWIKRTPIRYIVFSQKAPGDAAADTYTPSLRGHAPLPTWLVPVYHNADADVYEIRLPSNDRRTP